MKNSHDDAKLNSLMGKNVRVTFFEGTQSVGKLERDFDGKYRVDNWRFRKSHIKKIEVLGE
jgi:hypothetical protein